MAYAKLSGSLLACKYAPPTAMAAHNVPAPSVAPALASDEEARRLAHCLTALRLPMFLGEHERVARQCAAEGLDYSRYLLRLAELELQDRERRRVGRLITRARFPAVKSLDGFEFATLPTLDKDLVLELAQCEYIARRENVVIVGNSGTGKTHIAIALGLAACRNGVSVGFVTAAALVQELLSERRVLRRQRRIDAHKLLIIDELGYVPLPAGGAELLFEVFSRRCERGSTIVTSNLPIEQWINVFGTEQLTSALIDRLAYHVHVLELNGESYRLKHSNWHQPPGASSAS